MALLYVFSATRPAGISIWPPEIHKSDWMKQRHLYFKNEKFIQLGMKENDFYSPYEYDHGSFVDVRMQIIFDSEEALKAYADAIAMPEDIQQLANAWKSQHNITYDHKVYQLPEL